MSSAKITLPWLLQGVGAPMYMVPLLVPIRESGSLIPQFLMAGMVERAKKYKYLWCIASVLQGLCILITGIVAFKATGVIAGWMIISLLVVFSLARCLASISSKAALAKTIPKSKRGKTNGWTASAAGGLSIVFGLIFYGGWVGTTGQYVNSAVVGALLLVAGGCWFLAAAIFSGLTEVRNEKKTKKHGESLWKYYKPLSKDRVFLRYVTARALFLSTALSAPYYILLVANSSAFSTGVLGMFIIASGCASLLFGSVWGKLSDDSSRKVMITAGFLAAVTGLLVWLLYHQNSPIVLQSWFVPASYFFLEGCHQGVRVARKTFVVNISDADSRVAYVSASNTLIGMLLLISGVFIALASTLTVHGTIAMFSVVSLIGCCVAYGLPEAEREPVTSQAPYLP